MTKLAHTKRLSSSYSCHPVRKLNNIMGDRLLLNFSAKFQRLFKILLVKLHNLPWQRSVRLNGAKMAKKIQNVMNEDVRAGH